MEGDTLPNALAALARTRERTLAEIDEIEAARDDGAGATTGSRARETPSRVKVTREHAPDEDPSDA